MRVYGCPILLHDTVSHKLWSSCLFVDCWIHRRGAFWSDGTLQLILVAVNVMAVPTHATLGRPQHTRTDLRQPCRWRAIPERVQRHGIPGTDHISSGLVHWIDHGYIWGALVFGVTRLWA